MNEILIKQEVYPPPPPPPRLDEVVQLVISNLIRIMSTQGSNIQHVKQKDQQSTNKKIITSDPT